MTRYAIVDIETTGGYANANGITEIAIYVHDGEKVVDSYCSLIDPGRHIPEYISSFTGITNAMVEKAPSFENEAHKIFELLEGNVFVAHNVNFDYSFIRNQLASCGYKLTVKKLCTVRYSRIVFPGLPSYSLGNICAHLGIDISARHRAGGDAEATVKLFEMLLNHDPDQLVLSGFLKRGSKEYNLPPNLPREQFEKLPANTGVYYFHNEHGKVVYVGKALNLKTRVGQHFTGNSTGKQRQDFMRTIHAITYHECATELMALILESIEIKKHWPEFNRALKQREFPFGIYRYEDRNGYIRICVDKVRKHLRAVSTYRNRSDADRELQNTLLEFSLCPKLCNIDTSKEPCDPAVCKGACEERETSHLYNQRAEEAIAHLSNSESFAILGKGFSEDEISCILVEKGLFYGMGYISRDLPLDNVQELKSYIKPMRENFFIRELVDSDTVNQWGKRIRLSS